MKTEHKEKDILRHVRQTVAEVADMALADVGDDTPLANTCQLFEVDQIEVISDLEDDYGIDLDPPDVDTATPAIICGLIKAELLRRTPDA